MAAPREYELVLMLDSGLPETERAKLAQEAKGQIESGGTLKEENNWGLRKMAYEIQRRTEADYRWYRFEASTELLDSLDHNLKIADGVLRFRVFKVDPAAPSIVPPAAGASGPPRERVAAPAAAPAPAATPAAAPAADSAPAPTPDEAGAGDEESGDSAGDAAE